MDATTATDSLEKRLAAAESRLAEAERALREIAEGQHSEGARRLARAALDREVKHV